MGLNRVLVVDDDESIRQVLHDGLTARGFEVITAKDGKEGLKRAISEKPDAILLDILMPKMNGLEVIKQLRSDMWGSHVPVIIFSQLSPDDTITREIHKTEPSYFVEKDNWSLSEIAQKIRDIIHH